MSDDRIEVHETADGQFMALRVHGNNEKGSWTEGYTREEDAWRAARNEWPDLFNEDGEAK